MLIRKAEERDARAIADIIIPVIREGQTYALDRDMSEAQALAHWLSPDHETFVAEEDDAILGTYYLHQNRAGGGAHVANCGYMTSGNARGRGIARRMGEHSLAIARERGFLAMQYNFVVSVNAPAVTLWRSLGFEIVGRVPGAFRMPDGTFVDALVMYRQL